MMKVYKILIISLIMCFSLGLYAQYEHKGLKPNPKFAKLCVEFENWNEGLAEYRRLILEDSANVDYHYNIGVCVLHINDDKSESIERFEWVTKQDKCDKKAWYYLGMAYTMAYRFDDALNAYKKYQVLLNAKDDKLKISVERRIEMCKSAIQLVQHPRNVEFENLGDYVNGRFPDYNPYIPENESILIFSSQRQGNIGNYVDYDGYYTADLYWSKFRNKWKKIKKLPPSINSRLKEEIVGINNSGSQIIVYHNSLTEKDLFISTKRGKNYQQPIFLGYAINSKYDESSAAVSPDGRRIVFASNRDGNHTQKDLFIASKMPDGSWGEIVKLSDTINTLYNDEFPYFSPDGKNFYFSSQGHNSMGGYDLFKCEFDQVKNTFAMPQNLGFPINTPSDNKTICFTKSNRYAYVSDYRSDSRGDLDVYRLIFKEEQAVYTVLKGTIVETATGRKITEAYKDYVQRVDSLNQTVFTEAAPYFKKNDSVQGKKILEKIIERNDLLRVEIKVINQEDKSIYGVFRSNSLNSRYVVILPPGKFKLQFSAVNFSGFEISEYEVMERDNRENMIIKDVEMKNKELYKAVIPVQTDEY